MNIIDLSKCDDEVILYINQLQDLIYSRGRTIIHQQKIIKRFEKNLKSICLDFELFTEDYINEMISNLKGE